MSDGTKQWILGMVVLLILFAPLVGLSLGVAIRVFRWAVGG